MTYSNILEQAFDQLDARDAEMERDSVAMGYISPNQFEVPEEVFEELSKEPGVDKTEQLEDMRELAKALANKYGVEVVIDTHMDHDGFEWDSDKETVYPELREASQCFIKDFAHDHLVRLSGKDYKETDTDAVEKVIFEPTHFSFNYKGARISGPLSGVEVETQVLVDGEESDCARNPGHINRSIEKACGFQLDPSEFEEPEMDF